MERMRPWVNRARIWNNYPIYMKTTDVIPIKLPVRP